MLIRVVYREQQQAARALYALIEMLKTCQREEARGAAGALLMMNSAMPAQRDAPGRYGHYEAAAGGAALPLRARRGGKTMKAPPRGDARASARSIQAQRLQQPRRCEAGAVIFLRRHSTPATREQRWRRFRATPPLPFIFFAEPHVRRATMSMAERQTNPLPSADTPPLMPTTSSMFSLSMFQAFAPDWRGFRFLPPHLPDTRCFIDPQLLQEHARQTCARADDHDRRASALCARQDGAPPRPSSAAVMPPADADGVFFRARRHADLMALRRYAATDAQRASRYY